DYYCAIWHSSAIVVF
nr:immunoglobulin light chain junction region [Macaca mulatta]MOW06001.1 immunoglobulin light chain junction region [Macaca mulatta]